MLRPPVPRYAILLAALALLLPWALPLTVADSCADCLCGSAPGCCLPACCACCAHGAPVPESTAWAALRQVTVEVAPSPREAAYLSSHPHDIFHVPKS